MDISTRQGFAKLAVHHHIKALIAVAQIKAADWLCRRAQRHANSLALAEQWFEVSGQDWRSIAVRMNRSEDTEDTADGKDTSENTDDGEDVSASDTDEPF